MCALVAAGLATVQRQAADQGQRLAVARLLTSQAEAALGRDPRTALRLAEAAQQLSPGAETGSALAQLVRDTRYAGTLDGHTNTLSALAYTPDGGTLATASWDHTVLLWDLSGGRPRRLGEPLRHDSGVTALVFTPDGRTLVTSTASNDSPPVPALLTRWDVSNPARPYRSGEPATGPEFGAGSLAATPDGRTVAAGNDDGVQLWDLSDPGRLAPLGGVQGPDFSFSAFGVSAVRLAPDGRRLAVANGEGIRLWDLSDPRRPQKLGAPLAQGHAQGATVYALAFSPDGRALAAADADDSATAHLVLWDLAAPGGPQPFGSPLLPAGRTWSALAFAADGRRLAVGGADADTEVWDVTDPTRPARIGAPLSGHSAPVEALAFAPDGRTLVSASDDHTALLWDLTEPYQVRRVATLPGSATAVSADGRLLAGAGVPDLVATLWDVTDPARPPTLSRFPAGPDLPPGDYRFSSVAVAPDGGLLASYTSDPNHGTVILWDVRDPTRPRLLAPLPLPRAGSVHRLVFAPHQPLLAVATPDGVALFDVTDPTRPALTTTVPTGDFLSTVEFDPTGRTLLTTGPGASGLVRWDLSEPAAPRARGEPLIVPQSFGVAATFAPDGATVATASDDGSIALWAPDGGDRLQPVGQPLRGPGQPMMLSVAYAADGRTLAAGGPDQIVLWDLTDPAHPRQLGVPFAGHANTIGSMRLLPDGRTLAVVGPGDKSTGLWDLSPVLAERDQALALACWRTGDGLDRAEWARFVPDLDYEDSCADGG